MLIDLSRPLHDGMPVYPGDLPLSLCHYKKYAVDHYNAYHLDTGLHAGTHVDAPMHLMEDTRTIADIPLECFQGHGVLLEGAGFPDAQNTISEGSVVLIVTGMASFYGTPGYYSKHPVLSDDLTRMLVSRRIRLIGMDMPSPDYPPFPIHKILLSAGILIVENLTNLEILRGKAFTFYAFPLKIAAEASLVRAVAEI